MKIEPHNRDEIVAEARKVLTKKLDKKIGTGTNCSIKVTLRGKSDGCVYGYEVDFEKITSDDGGFRWEVKRILNTTSP